MIVFSRDSVFGVYHRIFGESEGRSGHVTLRAQPALRTPRDDVVLTPKQLLPSPFPQQRFGF